MNKIGNANLMDRELLAYRILADIFLRGAYSNIELNNSIRPVGSEDDRSYITRLVYGVLEQSVQFDYIIGLLAEKRPKNNLIIIIKIGLYLLRYMSVPEHAAISKTVELCKSLGKSGAVGFINAILRKSTGINISTLDFESFALRLSVIYSRPMWITEKLLENFGSEEAEKFLAFEPVRLTHIRHNGIRISKPEFDLLLSNKAANQKVRSKLGYYVSHNMMKIIDSRLFVVQSLASMLAVGCYLENMDLKKDCRILDLCAAPGGKSAYLKELLPYAEVTACDLHLHRLELMAAYAEKSGASIEIRQNDATVYRPEWDGVFDMVICDVPCSGIGVVFSKPDIILNRKPEDLTELSVLQSEILSMASRYVKPGGCLIYSTCTVLKEENQDVVSGFLRSNSGFAVFENMSAENDDIGLQLMPQTDSCDGFYIAKLRKLV